MNPELPGRRGWVRALGLSGLLFMLISLGSAIPLLREIQLRLTDTFFRVAPVPRGKSPVVLVLIDDESLNTFGRWPWSRVLLGQLTTNLAQSGAQVIGLDILLSEPQSAQADEALRHALEASGRAVIVDKIGTYPDGPRWIEPLPLFASSAAVGHALAVLDVDGVCRRFPARELTADGSRWSFAVEVARRTDPQRAANFLSEYEVPFTDESRVMTVAKPVLVPIHFRRGHFDTLSARQVLQGGDLSVLRNRPVLVGFGPTEISDRLNTPLSGEMPTPGVEVHAQILDSILEGRAMHQVPLWLATLLLMITCVAVVTAFLRWRGWATITLLVAITASVYAGALLAFIYASRILPVGPAMLAIITGPILVYAADFILVERSLARQLRELQGWLASRGVGAAGTRKDLSWRLESLRLMQTELGSLYELHETLLETSQSLVAIFDDKGSLVLKNQHFGLVCGPERATMTLDQLRAWLLPKEDAPIVATGSGEEGEAYVEGELYAVRSLPLPPTTLTPGGGTIVTLTSLRTRVERDRARAEALGFVTHELRTPLVAIQGFAELMARYPGSPLYAKAPETIFRESKRLLALINSYLDVLRLDAGARPIRSDSVQLGNAVRQAFEILEPLAAAANMRLVLESEEMSPIKGDAALLSGAVLNLVSNAIKYGKPGTDIQVRCERAGDRMVLRVHNHGKPIAPQDVPRLFDVYYRTASAESASTGWGLGLAFVKRIAEKHGGTVEVASGPAGTSFEIHLPMKTGTAAARGTA